MTQPTYFVPLAGSWSGGGRAVLGNYAWASRRHLRLSLDGGDVTIVNRNRAVTRLRGPRIMIPQNAWPWEGPKVGARERAKMWALRCSSEASMRRAAGVIRVGGSIPALGRTHPNLLPNPLDPAFEEAVSGVDDSAPPSASGYFASVGSVNSYRGLETLLDGYQLYRASGGRTPLVIRGGGPTHCVDRVDARASSIEGVQFSGRTISRHECLVLLRHASLTVLPSHVEASPLSLLEALAVQSRVIASDIAGHRDIVPAGTREPGWFTHPGPQALADHFHEADRAGSNAGERHALARASFRETARERWSDALVSALDDLSGGS